MNIRLLTHIILFICSSQIGLITSSHAALNVSVNPITGGNSLSFGRVDREVNREVRLRITSTDARQYQIYQRLVDPIINEKGMSLSSQAIRTYSLIGSNGFGTLYLQTPENLTQSEQLVYSSSPVGDSDSLTIVYSASPERMDNAGNFLGRIMYTVRSVGAGGQDQAFLTLTLDVSGNLTIDAQASSGSNRVELRYPRAQTQNYFKIGIKENRGEIKIFQDLNSLPQTPALDELDRNTLKVMVVSGGQSDYQQPKALEPKRVLIYSSNKSEDDVVINFTLDEELAAKAKAGQYQTQLKYFVEGSEKNEEISVDLVVNIEPVFNLDVRLPPEGVRFIDVLPDYPPQFKEVDVIVQTNLGKGYVVTQKVSTPMTNQRGKEIQKNYFTYKVEELLERKGQITATEFVPVELGDLPIYFSDAQGRSTQFKVYYRLQGYPGIEAGDYNVPITFSLQEK